MSKLKHHHTHPFSQIGIHKTTNEVWVVRNFFVVFFLDVH